MITVRSATEQDIIRIAELEGDCFPDAWSESTVRSSFLSDRYAYFVALSKEKVVGFVCLIMGEDFCEVARIAVDNSVRRMGFGKALLEKSLTHAYNSGVNSVYLEVRSENYPARALYESAGASACGERKNYYGSGIHATLYLFTRGEKPLGI